MLDDNHHAPAVALHPGKPPPEGYYAGNLLTVIETVLQRYGDILTADERHFGESIVALPSAAQRLLARLVARKGPVFRADGFAYPEVGAPGPALAALADAALIEWFPAVPVPLLCKLLTLGELERVFSWELARAGNSNKAERVARITATTPAPFCRWRMRRSMSWLRVLGTVHLELYRLLFFGDRHQDFTTFVMRDLGVHSYETVELSPATRLFADRASLQRLLALNALQDQVSSLGPRPDVDDCGAPVATLLAQLGDEIDNRALERRRSRTLNRLGRSLERAGEFDWALQCYARSTLAPARERRMRVLHRLGDADGVERLREAVLAAPETALEADFAGRFARPFRRQPVPITDAMLPGLPAMPIEHYALAELTAAGGTGWHLENNLSMAIFALAYWSWLFAPVEGAFLHPFQTGPVDLFWPDFFASRQGICDDPLDASLKTRLRATGKAKTGTANRLFSWQRCPLRVIETVVDAVPEADLRALVEIARDDLAGKRSGFPDLTVVYGPGRYEFVEVKGPNDQLQTHQHLWIRALRDRGLPVRVMRYRLKPYRS